MPNSAISAALIAAAARRNEGEMTIERKLRSANAHTHFSAVSLKLDSKANVRLERAIGHGTVKRTSDGRFYLCEPRIAERREGHVFMVLLMLLVIASVAASLVALIGSELH